MVQTTSGTEHTSPLLLRVLGRNISLEAISLEGERRSDSIIVRHLGGASDPYKDRISVSSAGHLSNIRNSNRDPNPAPRFSKFKQGKSHFQDQ